MRKTFRRGSGPVVHAVNGVSLQIAEGETVALIGESGSGKSTVARLALRLQEPDSGTIEFDGRDLASLDHRELRRERAKMTIVFQEPYESLNPRKRVGAAIGEPLIIHEQSLPERLRRARVIEALERVALSEGFYGRYPHELSGGQQQRVGIARALITRPKFIVLDEPTSSLDVSVRAQILELLTELRRELHLAYLFISHDVSTVAYMSDRLAVMYLGRIVEVGATQELLAHPEHPYTQALLSAVLSPDPDVKTARVALGGEIPSPVRLPTGCVLHPRCPIATAECSIAPVPLHPFSVDHEVACIKVPWADSRLQVEA